MLLLVAGAALIPLDPLSVPATVNGSAQALSSENE